MTETNFEKAFLMAMAGIHATDEIDLMKPRDGELRIGLRCSDCFAWGTSDWEEVTPDNLQVLCSAIEDLSEIGELEADCYVGALFAARVRNERPMNLLDYSTVMADETRELFGRLPVREIGGKGLA